jgi:hypothetical protein
MNEVLNEEFSHAVKDFAYLIDNDYPRKAILKIIGDRYLLNKTQRVLLSRGIFRTDEIHARAHKRTNSIRNALLHVDTYNVLFILSNYLLGRIVFISNDDLLRDAGEVYGKLHREKVFFEAIGYLLNYIKQSETKEVHFLIDRSVSFSGELAEKLRTCLDENDMKGDARTFINPDAELIMLTDGIIATSDSEIIDGTNCKICDLPYLVLNYRFNPQLPDLRKILS